ncbi:metalloendopeptidase OMA1, mitochondrial-like [Asterias rubens]|uniref:metalloendopeptidase OMA1, mitochondrial-like n=1 Tax=Asterias rubens TaxID=7604 RepID=UPI0014551849|nr:metalloendopeptidase OMA1, mitochondrial-like [Asterias rubens]XP_033636535.1 metalloendopeptidase OMA1, mitochondrial-like [Asterias rubens]
MARRFLQQWMPSACRQYTRSHCNIRWLDSLKAQRHPQIPQTNCPTKQTWRTICTSAHWNRFCLNTKKPSTSRQFLFDFSTGRSRTLLYGRDRPVKVLKREFKTSPQHQALPAVIALLVVKPIAKLTAIFSGRFFRNWWKALPHNKRQYFYESLRRNKYTIAAALAGLTGVGALYYYSHLQMTPITNRRRFIALTDNQFRKIAETEYEKMKSLHVDNCVHSSHPLYLTIGRIVLKITEANQDIPRIADRTWTIHIIDKDEKNAFVLPNGEIFVFTGILKAVSNEEQLGTVLAHEIAHVVLNHAAEQVSFTEFVDLLLIVVLAALWALLPSDGIALVATWFKQKVVELVLEMPYSRSLEAEADEVGLILAAKSCFDVRESKAFLESMALQSNGGGEDLDIEWLSTHPTHQNRADKLDTLMPQALALRKLCKCPPLPKIDPSLAVQKQKEILQEERERRKEQPVVMSGIQISS